MLNLLRVQDADENYKNTTTQHSAATAVPRVVVAAHHLRHHAKNEAIFTLYDLTGLSTCLITLIFKLYKYLTLKKARGVEYVARGVGWGSPRTATTPPAGFRYRNTIASWMRSLPKKKLKLKQNKKKKKRKGIPYRLQPIFFFYLDFDSV